MFQNGEKAIERVLELVSKCPKEFQEKCFEILLTGYIQSEVHTPSNRSTTGASVQGHAGSPAAHASTPETAIPTSIQPRFRTTAKRLGIELVKLEELFDFNADPFVLHAIAVPGNNSAEKTRNIALLAATRSYLASGTWTADRQEVKALCVDHNCYDIGNFAAHLKKGDGTLFKGIDSSKPLELSSNGIKEAEKLLKTLSGGDAS